MTVSQDNAPSTEALRAQLCVVYAYAGVAKLNWDWLLHGEPMASKLVERAQRPQQLHRQVHRRSCCCRCARCSPRASTRSTRCAARRPCPRRGAMMAAAGAPTRCG